MSHSDSTRERAVLAFLEQLLQDRERGALRSEDEYVARFPAIEARVREELAAMQLESAAIDAESDHATERRIGPYRLGRVIGEGGQGIVYEAMDTRHGREVALKVLPRALASADGGLPPQLQREVEALARLDHPGICVVHDAGEAEGQVYLAMRLVRGRPLHDFVGKMPWQEAVRCLAKVAQALHVAHQAGVVHRDVKPANILIEESAEPVLVDFGLARAEGGELPTLTRTGDVLGTPHYLAPERLNGQAHRDPRGDVWSLGVCLHELLSGQRPFRGHSLEAVAQAVARDEPEALHRLQPQLPRDLAVVVQTALTKEPGRRYQNAEELAEELERVLRGEPIHARPISLAGRTGRWIRRNPAPTAILTLLAIGAGTGAWAAEAFRGLAQERSGALADAEAHLAASRLEQARLLEFSRKPGRSFEMAARLNEAAAARDRALLYGASATELPQPEQIRSLALDAELAPDATVTQTIDFDGYLIGSVSQHGRFVAGRRVLPTASGLLTQAVWLFDTLSGEQLAQCDAADLLDRQEGQAISPDGRWYAAPSPDESSLDVWDLRAGERVLRLPLPEEIQLQPGERQVERHLRYWKILFSPDGSKLGLSVAPRETRITLPSPRGYAVWDVQSGERLLGARAGTTRYPWLSFSADSQRVVVQPEPQVVEVFDLATADADNVASSLARVDLGTVVKAATLAPGEALELVVVAGPDPGNADLLVRVDPTTGSIRWRRQLGEAYEWAHAPGLVCTADGDRFLMAMESGAIEVVDMSSGQPQLRIEQAHEARIESMAWLPSETGFTSHARAGKSKRWWIKPRADFLDEFTVPHGGVVGGMFASDYAGQTFAFIAEHQRETVHYWEAEPAWRDRLELQASRRAASTYELLMDPPGNYVFEIGTTLCTQWDLESGAAVHREPAAGAEFIHGGFDQRFDLWLVERAQGRFSLVRFHDGERRSLDQLPDSGWLERSDRGAFALAIPADDSADEPTLAQLTADGDYAPLREQSWPGLPQQAELHRRNARISEDGRWVAMLVRDEQYELYLWDVADSRLVAKFPMGSDPEWSSFDFDSEGQWLAYGTDDGRLHLFDLTAEREWASWQAHQTEVRYLRFVGGDDDLMSWASLEPVRSWKQQLLLRRP